MRERASPLQLAGAFVGSVIGAGFATGQEHLQFFVAFGPAGYAGLVLAGALMTLGGGLVLRSAQARRTRSHRDLLRTVPSAGLARLVDAVLSAALFLSVAVMLAGGGAVGAALWSLPPFVGGLLLGTATALVVALDLGRMLNVNGVLTAILVLLIAYVAMAAPGGGAEPAGGWLAPAMAQAGAGAASRGWVPPSWVLAALLYAAYNLTFCFPLFGSLGAGVARAQEAWTGAVVGGGLLTLLGAGVCAAVAGVAGSDGTAGALPMMAAAAGIGPAVARLYAVAVWLAMLTTAIAGTFTLSRRLAGLLPLPPPVLGAAVVAAALPVSLAGFGPLVATAYPAAGYVGTGCSALAAAAWAFGRRGGRRRR